MLKPDQPAEIAAPGSDSIPDKPAPARRRASSLPWLLSGFLLMLIAAGGGYLSWPLWKHQLPGYLRLVLEPVMQAGRDVELRRDVTAIKARLTEVESQIMLMRRTLAKTSAAGSEKEVARRARIAARLAGIEKSIDGLRNSAGADAGLAQRLTRLETEAAGDDGRAASVALAQRLVSLDRRVRALASRPVGQSGDDGRELAALRADNDRKFATLQRNNAANAALQRNNKIFAAAINDVTRKLAALEARPVPKAAPPPPPSPQVAANGGGLLLAVGQLREALRGSAPYGAALDAVRALGEGDEAVAKAVAALQPYAARGIKGRAALQERFRATAIAVARAALAPEGADWIDQTIARLSRVITVRRTGDAAQAAGGAAGKLARAEARMKAGDLAGAVAALDGLQGKPAKAAAAWLEAAHGRLDADAALAALGAHAIGR
ncbi:MAG: COG4223 family protein, partial [Alphaproteobacteria bacterium]